MTRTDTALPPANLRQKGGVVEKQVQEIQAVASDSPRVLIVGSDRKTRGELADIFDGQGFSPHELASGGEAEALTRREGFNLVVLDSTLGDGGALAVCRRLAMVQNAPIIMVSNETDVTERIIALEIGADDLIARPFHSREILARARALLRRARSANPHQWDGIGRNGALSTATRVLTGPLGTSLTLAPAVFGLLQVFISNPGELVTPEGAIDAMGKGSISEAHFRTTILRLRSKMVEAGFDRDSITTVRSGGYVMSRTVSIRLEFESVGAPPGRGRQGGRA